MLDNHTFQLRIDDNQYVKGTKGGGIKTAEEGCGGLKNFQSAGSALRYSDRYLREVDPELVKVHWRVEEMDYMQAPDERLGYAVRFQDENFNDGEGVANLVNKLTKNSKNKHRNFVSGFRKGHDKDISQRYLQDWNRVYRKRDKAENLKADILGFLAGDGRLKPNIYCWADSNLNDQISDDWRDYEFNLVKVVLRTVTTLDKDIVRELT